MKLNQLLQAALGKSKHLFEVGSMLTGYTYTSHGCSLSSVSLVALQNLSRVLS